VYETTRVELLRDVYIWAYERSTQEYMAIKKNLTEPDPMRLVFRCMIKETIRQVVRHPQLNTMRMIEQAVDGAALPEQRDNLQTLITEELKRLHEGVLSRYGLQPSELIQWQQRTSQHGKHLDR
jgi:hypothetical protein